MQVVRDTRRSQVLTGIVTGIFFFAWKIEPSTHTPQMYSQVIRCTHPFEPLEVFPEKADRVVRAGDAQLHNALLQDLLDVCKENNISLC